MRFDAQPGISKYTVVVAQHESSGLFYYTLGCFCQSPFTLHDVVDSYPIEKEVMCPMTCDVSTLVVERTAHFKHSIFVD